MYRNDKPVSSNPKRASRSAYIWNTASGLLMAFQSVVMLTVVTHSCDMISAGVLTLAYANANLFLNVGKFGMRNYQVSDIAQRFSFRVYLSSRLITCVAMIVAGSIHLAYSAATIGYSHTKTLTILVMILFKVVDALEDVFHANYQQNGCLDVAARVLTIRLATTIAIFGVGVVESKSLLAPLVVSTAYTACFFIGETLFVHRRFGLPVVGEGGGRNVFYLLKSSFPVFMALFLLFYIGNAPKYAIDSVMNDAAQAYYGFISMPVFVIGLLASFVYNPIVVSLAEDWAHGRTTPFLQRFALQVLIIGVITLICMAGAWFVGVPVLNLLYNTQLDLYKTDLLVLLAGGGFLALTTLFTTGITIIRQQEKLIWGYLCVSILAYIASSIAVDCWGISGASWVYLGLMFVLSLWFAIVFFCGVHVRREIC